MKTVAVIGASTDRHKFGNKAVRAYAQRGFTVWPGTSAMFANAGKPSTTGSFGFTGQTVKPRCA